MLADLVVNVIASDSELPFTGFGALPDREPPEITVRYHWRVRANSTRSGTYAASTFDRVGAALYGARRRLL